MYNSSCCVNNIGRPDSVHIKVGHLKIRYMDESYQVKVISPSNRLRRPRGRVEV
jgi:hypothetical protein